MGIDREAGKAMKNTERDPFLQKVMPHDPMAEKAVIGGLMLDNSSLADVLEVVSRDGEDFYHTVHQKIFKVIADLTDKGTIADSITICSVLESRGDLAKVGGHLYISELLDSAISSANLSHYAKIIKGKSIERRIISEASRLIETAYNPALPTQDILAVAQKTILSLSFSNEHKTLQVAKDVALHAHKLIESRYEKDDGMIIGLPTGFHNLDELTGGLIDGDMWVIAARPGMGKTAFAVDIAYRASLSGYRVVIFSLEMPSKSLMIRILSGMTEIDSRLLSRGLIQEHQWPKLANAAEKIGRTKLYIDDKASITPTEILAKCRKLKNDPGLDLIVVDYLQLMKLPGNYDSREQQVAEISRSMKMIARELNVPVMALSQLNRNVEQRINDKRPGLGDLRESGAIEQDADVIAFIYRDEMYNKSDDNPEKGLAEIIIGKHRNGPTGAVKLRYHDKYTRFENMDQRERKIYRHDQNSKAGSPF